MNKMNFEFKRFPEPVRINCNVEGRNLIAKIIGEYDHPMEFVFLIEFSDGVKIIEGPITESINAPELLPYLKAIEKSLADFINVMHHHWYQFEINDEGQLLLIWVAQNDENENQFSVYFEGDYQFNLEKTDTEWKCWSVRELEPNPIKDSIVKKVTEYLDATI